MYLHNIIYYIICAVPDDIQFVLLTPVITTRHERR